MPVRNKLNFNEKNGKVVSGVKVTFISSSSGNLLQVFENFRLLANPFSLHHEFYLTCTGSIFRPR